MPVLSDVVVMFCSPIVAMTAHDKFWVVPVLHAARDVKGEQTACRGAVTSLGTGAGATEQVSSSIYSPRLELANRELVKWLDVTLLLVTTCRHEK